MTRPQTNAVDDAILLANRIAMQDPECRHYRILLDVDEDGWAVQVFDPEHDRVLFKSGTRARGASEPKPS